jgi:hypothetical protein
MDINYHYFAVKVLAVKAGFSEPDAQVIASYSQFVDDFDTYRYLYFKEVPDFAQYLAVKVPTGWIFNPVTTGFNSFFDYTRLSIEKYQKHILVPFHFITQEPINVVQRDRREYRVKPVTMNKASLLQGLLKKASDQYIVEQNRNSLIRIGTLLHVFADTYAHQRFSGFWNWENHAYLKDAVNNIDGSNITSSYSPNMYYYVPSIGHPNVSTAPDDSNVAFSMLQKTKEHENFPYPDEYERDNTDEFIKASKEIFEYLRGCRGYTAPVDSAVWDDLALNLRKGFLTAEKDIKKLADFWKKFFADIPFYYSKNDMYTSSLKTSSGGETSDPEINDEIVIEVMSNQTDGDVNNVMLTGVNEDFFDFNVIADTIRKAVNPDETIDIEFTEYSKELNLKDYSIADE